MKRFLLLFPLWLLLTTTAHAHPHMSLSARLEFEYDGELCVGFWETWEMDAFFSASIIHDLDDNGDGRLDDEEIQRIYGYAFINLRKYGYFTYLRIGNRRWNPEAVERFSAKVRDGHLVYRFYVGLPEAERSGALAVAIFDTTYYCAVSYSEDAAKLTQLRLGAPVPSWSRAVNRSQPVYYSPAGAPTDGTIYTKWKPGLEIAYPEEIIVDPAQ